MSNVLPEDEKKKLYRKVKARFLFAGALTLLTGAVVSSLALTPAFIQVHLAQASIEASQNAARGARDDQAKIIRAQKYVSALQPIAAATSSPSEIAAGALGLKPSGISIVGVNYTKKKLEISGVSKNRDAVNAYREALEKSNTFTKVSVPVSALVGAQEGRFTITLSGTF